MWEKEGLPWNEVLTLASIHLVHKYQRAQLLQLKQHILLHFVSAEKYQFHGPSSMYPLLDLNRLNSDIRQFLIHVSCV